MSIFFKYNYYYSNYFRNKKWNFKVTLKRYIKIYKDPFHISFTLLSLNFLIGESLLIKAKIKPLIKTQLKHQMFNHIVFYNMLLLR